MKQDEMLKKAEAIQRDTVAYIGMVQPVVDEYNQFRETFAKKAHQVVGALVERHIVEPGKKAELIEKLAADPSQALDLALSISRRVGLGDGLGKAAELGAAATSNLDPFERLYYFGDSRANVSNFDGNVE